MAKLSKYFTWAEVTHSQTASRFGIDNSLPDSLKANVIATSIKLDQVREVLGSAMLVTSWYRCLELNRRLGSKDTSDHPKGLAVDFISPRYGTPAQVCKALLKYKQQLNWDQLILEHSWIHIAFSNSDPHSVPRNQVLSLQNDGTFKKGLLNAAGIHY